MRPIQTIAQLHGLQNETWIYAAIVAIVIVVLSVLTANAIRYRGGDDRSYITRRMWWIGWTVGGTLAFWIYNKAFVLPAIHKVAFQNQFASTNLWCSFAVLLGSAALSMIFMFCFRRTKFGSILGRQKER